MLNIGGELAFILQDIEYSTKKELLEKLRFLRSDLSIYPKEEQKQIRPIISVSIQQAFYLSEWELMKYKDFCKYMSENEKIKNIG